MKKVKAKKRSGKGDGFKHVMVHGRELVFREIKDKPRYTRENCPWCNKPPKLVAAGTMGEIGVSFAIPPEHKHKDYRKLIQRK